MLRTIDARYNHLRPPDGEFLKQHLRDLENARQVQQNLFPRGLPCVPGREFAGLCKPARRVAGDYYDLFELGSGQVVVALGDVAVKGLGSALVMAGLHAVVRCRLRQFVDDLARLVEELNGYLLTATAADVFVSLFLAVLDTGTGQLRYVNAGHPPPIALRAAEDEPTRGRGLPPPAAEGVPLPAAGGPHRARRHSPGPHPAGQAGNSAAGRRVLSGPLPLW
jgi:serine phosphatase RsbU (regulator of sigma subunit)